MYSLSKARRLWLILLAQMAPFSVEAQTNVGWKAEDFGYLRFFQDDATPSTFAIDAASEVMGNVVQCAEACAITKVGFRQGVATGTPCQHQVSIQGVSATTGGNDGTIKSSGNAKATFTPVAGGDNSIQDLTLTSSYTCTRGELLALTIGDDTSDGCTPSGVNTESFSYQYGSGLATHFPYVFQTPGGTLSKSNGLGLMSYSCGTTKYGFPSINTGQQQFGDDSSFDEYGNLFSGQWPSSETRTIAGVRYRGSFGAAGKAFRARITCSGGGTGTFTGDSDQLQRTDGGKGAYDFLFQDASLPTATGSETCRVTLRCDTTGGTSCSMMVRTVNANGDLEGAPGGLNVYGTKRANDGAWTDENTKVYSIEPIIRTISAGGSSGPKQNLPGAGGMQ